MLEEFAPLSYETLVTVQDERILLYFIASISGMPYE